MTDRTPLADVLARLRQCEWIDLTHAFGPGIPHYFAFPDEERETLFHFDEGVGSTGTGFLAHRFTHIGQWGTHVDPPAHFARGGRFLDELPVTDMILPLVVIPVRRQVAAVAVVYRAGATIGQAAPTPGGLGAVEAALAAGLTAATAPTDLRMHLLQK